MLSADSYKERSGVLLGSQTICSQTKLDASLCNAPDQPLGEVRIPNLLWSNPARWRGTGVEGSVDCNCCPCLLGSADIDATMVTDAMNAVSRNER